MRKSKKINIFLLLFVILIIGFSIRYLKLLDNEGFYFDEGYGFVQGQVSVSKLLTGDYVSSAEHPFGNYLLLHFLSKFGKSEFFLRLPYLFFGIIANLIIEHKFRRENYLVEEMKK